MRTIFCTYLLKPLQLNGLKNLFCRLLGRFGPLGGALVDERGNVIGIVSAKLSARAALAATGALPENVNYAVKSPDVSGLSFLESVPDVANKLKAPVTAERKFEDVVKSAQDAAVLVY